MPAAGFAVLVAAALLMLLLAIAAVAAVIVRQGRQQRIHHRLVGIGAVDSEFDTQRLGPLLGALSGPGRALDRVLDGDGETAGLLLQAGWRSARARAAYFALQAALPVLLVFGAVASAALDAAGQPILKILAVLVALIIGLLAPRWLLRSRAAARRRRMQAEVPLLIHVLVLLYDAGLSTRQAIASLVREGGGVLPALGPEFALILRQLEAGADTGDVLGAVGRQLDVSDLGSVLSVVRQVERYGGEVRDPLMETLAVMEQRRSLELREQVNLMSGRMTLVMVLFFFPALLIFVAGPAVVSIFSALGSVN